MKRIDLFAHIGNVKVTYRFSGSETHCMLEKDNNVKFSQIEHLTKNKKGRITFLILFTEYV